MAQVAEPIAVEALVARHPERTVAAGAGVVSYREAGADPALVLLHGIGSGAASWVHQLEALSTRFRVIAWDAPGYGRSTALAGTAPAAADYAQALASFLDALRVDRLVLVGHSLGALIATRFAAAQPGRVRGLVLLNPARGYRNAPPEVRKQKLDDRLEAMARLGPAGHARERVASLVGPGASQAARDLIVWNGSRLDSAGYAQAARMLADGDLADDARRVTGRVLVACGSEDRVTPESGCREIAAAFARAEYRSLPGLGHASYIENPTAVDDAIAAFAQSLEMP